MNKLLIHSNNTAFNKTNFFLISEQFVFDVDFDKDVDFYIDENITGGDLKRKLDTADIVFIKVSLSQNYLEYLGIRLAYHIRLTKSLGEKANIPIVFVSEESLQFLGLTYPEPSIFFTKGIYFIKESIEDFEKALRWYIDGNIKGLEQTGDFIEALNIAPPANYQSHHSITNEWSVLRWAKVLNIPFENIQLKGIKQNIESLLYYKFLQLKYPIRSESNELDFKIEGKGKILYIDDEWNKGWNLVLKNIFSSLPGVTFETFENEFKDKSQDVIIKECIQKILENEPDVILLDLRLSDSDFGLNKTKALSGYLILDIVKSINPGIQVVIFTASNKVWNLIELQTIGADKFVLKESPELSADGSFSKLAIEQLASSVSESFKMSFLKKIHVKMKEIELLLNNGSLIDENDFSTRLKNNLEVTFKLLKDTKMSSKYFNYAFLQLFQIIEDFSNLPSVFREGTDNYVIVNDNEVLVQQLLSEKIEYAISFESGKYRIQNKFINVNPREKAKRLDTNFKVSALLIFRLGYENSSFLKWTDIYSIRNTKAAHFNIEDSLNENAIFTILNFICEFINSDNQKETNIDKGLKIKSFEESLELLKNRFKK